MTPFSFRRRLIVCRRGYGRQDFHADLSAGVTVGVVALPYGIAVIIAYNMADWRSCSASTGSRRSPGSSRCACCASGAAG